MSGYRYVPGHSRVPRLSGTLPLVAAPSIDTHDVREEPMSPSKGPHRRHRYAVCPTCHTELRQEDKRESTVVCPECDSLVPIGSGGEVDHGPSSGGS